MFNKTPEFWIALVAASLYVYRQSADKVLPARVIQTGIATGFGYSLGGEISIWADLPEGLTMVATTCGGYLVLDFCTALLGDRKELIALFMRFVGKK